MDLKIVSYNCRGIKSSIPLLWKMCDSNDIILLQETMICSHNLDMIHTIHPDFYAGGCSSINSDEYILNGRSHGGLAVLWRKTIGYVKTKKYSDLIYGIELTGSNKILILNVYLPQDNNSLSHLTIVGKFWGKYLLLYKTVTPMRLLSWVILMLIVSADLERI